MFVCLSGVYVFLLIFPSLLPQITISSGLGEGSLWLKIRKNEEKEKVKQGDKTCLFAKKIPTAKSMIQNLSFHVASYLCCIFPLRVNVFFLFICLCCCRFICFCLYACFVFFLCDSCLPHSMDQIRINIIWLS